MGVAPSQTRPLDTRARRAARGSCSENSVSCELRFELDEAKGVIDVDERNDTVVSGAEAVWKRQAHQHRLVGLRGDCARRDPLPGNAALSRDCRDETIMMNVGDLCDRDVTTIAPDETVVEAAKRMRDANVTELIVVQGVDSRTRPIGILTEHDLVTSVIARGLEPSKLQVSEVLTDGFLAVTTDEGVDETLHRMRCFSLRRLPVIDRSGVLYGVITLEDLLASIRDDIYERLEPGARREAAHRLGESHEGHVRR